MVEEVRCGVAVGAAENDGDGVVCGDFGGEGGEAVGLPGEDSDDVFLGEGGGFGGLFGEGGGVGGGEGVGFEGGEGGEGEEEVLAGGVGDGGVVDGEVEVDDAVGVFEAAEGGAVGVEAECWVGWLAVDAEAERGVGRTYHQSRKRSSSSGWQRSGHISQTDRKTQSQSPQSTTPSSLANGPNKPPKTKPQ